MENCILLVLRRKDWGIRNLKICLSSAPYAVPTHEAEWVGVPANLALNCHGNLIELAPSEAETGRSDILSSFSNSTCGSYWHTSVLTLHLPTQKGLPSGEDPPYFGFICQEMTPLCVLIMVWLTVQLLGKSCNLYSYCFPSLLGKSYYI